MASVVYYNKHVRINLPYEQFKYLTTVLDRFITEYEGVLDEEIEWARNTVDLLRAEAVNALSADTELP